MNNKNILLVISKFPPEYSGPGVRIPRLYEWFEEKNYNLNLNVICNGIEQIKNEEYIFEGMAVRRITAEFLNKIFLKLKFIPQRLAHAIIYQYEFIKTFFILFFGKKYKNTDFLHVAGHSGGTVAALLWAKLRKIPVLLELVNSSARPHQKFFFIFKVTIHQNGKIAYLTKCLSKGHQSVGLIEEQLWIKPNPVDIEKYHMEKGIKDKMRRKLTPYKSTDKIILSIAKLIPRKNQFFLLKVLKEMPEEFKLVLAGPAVEDGPNFERDKKYFQDMLSFIKEGDLSERVHIISGYVKSDKYMKLADVYVLPAWGEGFGTPMLEAMACGLPVVANKEEPAFQEWIIEGENGYLCDINDSEEWKQAIEKTFKFTKEQRFLTASKIHNKAGQEVIFNNYKQIIRNLIRAR